MSNTPENSKVENSKDDMPISNEKFNIKDIPYGICKRCGILQTAPGQDGFFICGERNNWACYRCKYGQNGPKIPSRCIGSCEWCTYRGDGMKYYQGGCYKCPRCTYFKLKH